jgi:hypothetical protein
VPPSCQARRHGRTDPGIPEADVLEQRQEVSDDQNDDEPWWDEGQEKDQDEVKYDEGE